MTFKSPNHETKVFTKNLIASEYINHRYTPAGSQTIWSPGQDGTERAIAYKGELNYFKQGAYNQTNGKNPEKNMVWHTGAETQAEILRNNMKTEVIPKYGLEIQR